MTCGLMGRHGPRWRERSQGGWLVNHPELGNITQIYIHTSTDMDPTMQLCTWIHALTLSNQVSEPMYKNKWTKWKQRLCCQKYKVAEKMFCYRLHPHLPSLPLPNAQTHSCLNECFRALMGGTKSRSNRQCVCECKGSNTSGVISAAAAAAAVARGI